MADEEGSVMIDGEDFEADDQDQDTSTETQDSTDQAETTQEQDPKAASQADQQDTKEQPQLTEKGTKLDSDPMSAVNQQLANERAKARQYEQFLNDPQKVKAYLQELERERGGSQPAPTSTGEEIRPEQIQTVEDVQKFLAQERAKDRQEVEELKKYVGQFSQVQGQLAVGDRIRNDIVQVRQKYPELDPNSPDYDEALEKGLGEFYEELDLDQKTGNFRGQVSLSRLAERFMSAAKRGEKQGSRRAQTAVADRRAGRVRTGAKDKGEEVDESKLSPSQIIASRMVRANRRVR
jgi:hypothetical protein